MTCFQDWPELAAAALRVQGNTFDRFPRTFQESWAGPQGPANQGEGGQGWSSERCQSKADDAKCCNERSLVALLRNAHADTHAEERAGAAAMWQEVIMPPASPSSLGKGGAETGEQHLIYSPCLEGTDCQQPLRFHRRFAPL